MRICFIVNEIFAWGRYGGFGKLVRVLGTELIRRGVDVVVVCWRGPDQGKREYLDGMTIFGLPYDPIDPLSSRVFSYFQSIPLYKEADADIYVSIEAQLSTLVAQKAMPEKKHLVYFQDPYDENAYRSMSVVDSNYEWNTKRKIQFYTTLGFLRNACHNADALLTQAKCFVPTIRRLFTAHKKLVFLPNPVRIPVSATGKASEPTVCFTGRWDPQKRVELFLKLATSFPDVRFIALGKSHNREIDGSLRERYRKVKNLQMPGFVTEIEKSNVLARSWVLVNTSIREGLPLTFLEALAHKAALLSYVNPDNFTARFGYHASDEDFALGLEQLLSDNIWKKRGEEGFAYVSRIHNLNRVVERHMVIYNEVAEN